MTLSPLFFLAAALPIFHVSAQVAAATAAPPPQPLPAAAREFLSAHNDARASVGVQPLTWSQQLASAANRLAIYQREKMGCQFANLTGGKHGANQLLARGGAVTPGEAVEEWVKQKQFYNHADNTCAPGHRCGVYTQVVWRKTVTVGCGQATCAKEDASLTICFYDPPGNYVGESPY